MTLRHPGGFFTPYCETDTAFARYGARLSWLYHDPLPALSIQSASITTTHFSSSFARVSRSARILPVKRAFFSIARRFTRNQADRWPTGAN